jgi:hypothetical protein
VIEVINHSFSILFFPHQGGELQWFLGVAVIHDRASKTIWLAQSNYIAIMERFLGPEKEGPEKEGSRRKPRTPMGLVELLPYEGKALYYEINLYQCKIGTLLYAAVITRPDVSSAMSCLVRFNLNPSPQHQAAADRIIEYLLATKDYVLKLGGEDGMATWSDASFANNTLARTSSQAYVMKLFGGAVAWIASKQDTVTTSTTEVEQLALAQATKEALYARWLIDEIGVTLDDNAVRMLCDNTQTIGLVTKETATLQTKLRHVDIHNHWLREAVEKGQIIVSYMPSKDMVADGLTKALGETPLQRFRDLVGVEDVSLAL